jgi:hypothetical protein
MRSRHLLVLSLLLLFLVACSINPSNPAVTLTSNAGLVKTIVAGTLTSYPTRTSFPTSTPTITPVSTPTDTWVEHKIDLSGAVISTPSDWLLQEVNRRPEINDDTFGPPVGHDCANYEITSSDGLAVLHLRDSCRFSDPQVADFPPDGVIINPDAGEGRIVRYIYEDVYYYQPVFVFEEGTLAPGSAWRVGEDYLYLFCPIAFGDAGTYISFTYNGPLDQIDEVFSILDRIVQSIQK